METLVGTEWTSTPCSRHYFKYLLEEIVLAEQLTVAGETLFVQLHPTLAALETFGVPRPVGHLEDEPVQDELVTAATFGNGGCKKIIKMVAS